jgi:hypothetical protein
MAEGSEARSLAQRTRLALTLAGRAADDAGEYKTGAREMTAAGACNNLLHLS